ncbi:hypothetical protein F5B20DRAFT_228176 [Whalleya microplaca]|nr:hypothetical protein F5B20DRAFT_228176 [Whalleya microplaca]
MRASLSHLALLPLTSSSHLLSPDSAPAAAAVPTNLNLDLAPLAVSGNTDCAAASASGAASFALSFISYGNYTALPGSVDTLPQLISISFAVTNDANGVSTACAFPLGGLAGDGTWADSGPAWQPCADRKDSDGTHRFAILTGAEFGLVDRYVAVNQTWFCHDDDDDGRLVAYTGVASSTLTMSCTESEVSDYHLQNCTSVDVRLPVTLL